MNVFTCLLIVASSFILSVARCDLTGMYVVVYQIFNTLFLGVGIGPWLIFAGGSINAGDTLPSSVVDMFNVLTSQTMTATLSVARMFLSSAIVNSNLYTDLLQPRALFIGGEQQGFGTAYNTIDEFDLNTLSWTSGEISLSSARVNLGVASYQQTVIVAGGT